VIKAFRGPDIETRHRRSRGGTRDIEHEVRSDGSRRIMLSRCTRPMALTFLSTQISSFWDSAPGKRVHIADPPRPPLHSMNLDLSRVLTSETESIPPWECWRVVVGMGQKMVGILDCILHCGYTGSVPALTVYRHRGMSGHQPHRQDFLGCPRLVRVGVHRVGPLYPHRSGRRYSASMGTSGCSGTSGPTMSVADISMVPTSGPMRLL
jgi:hypothetical protein